MSVPEQSHCRNKLLRLMTDDDFGRLATAFDTIDARQRDCLCPAGRPTEHVYFPESGIASVTSQAEPIRIEIGVIGREGFAGLTALLGDGASPNVTFVQSPGVLLRLPVHTFRAAIEASLSLRALLLRYVQAYIVQVTSTAVANASFTVEQRLARWLLMANDRGDGDEITLTHDFLSMMLGVRRPGVTVATHILEGKRAIRTSRGHIHVADRNRLVQIANGSYGLAEAEYDRLFG